MSRKSRLTALALLLLTIAPATARAQLVVLDPGNLVQAVLISERTWRQYQTLYDQYQLIRRMSRGLSSLDAYRIPAIATTRHDSSRLPYGRPWLDALNSGDPGGKGIGLPPAASSARQALSCSSCLPRPERRSSGCIRP
jgi:hypothetical protein